MSDEPEAPSRLSPRQWRILKWLAIGAAAPSVILFSLVAFFVARTEYMHEESRCPFERIESRAVGDSEHVLEEGRSCQPDVEEHRWTLYHDDGSRRELGRRRLTESHYAHYGWTVRTEDGSVIVVVHNDGVEDATFREAPPPPEKQR